MISRSGAFGWGLGACACAAHAEGGGAQGSAPLPANYSKGIPGYLTPPQLVMTSAGTSVQQVLSEFLEHSSQLLLV